jgi:PAS domain S-box-containing protein
VTDHEDELLRSVALQNANAILLARQRAEQELLQTKEALRESQERLTAALTAAGTGTFRWSFEKNTVQWDRNLDRLFGLRSSPPAQSLDAFIAAIHRDDRAAVLARCQQAARDGSDIDMEFRVVWSDGSVHWIHDKAKAVCDEKRRPLYLTGACADITARKETEAALREETRILELLNQTGQTLASTLQLEALVQAVTDAATQICGAESGAFFFNSPSDASGTHLLSLLSAAPDSAFATLGALRATSPRDVTPEPPFHSHLAVAVRSRTGDAIGGLLLLHSQRGAFTARTEELLAGVAAQAGIAIDNARLYEAAQASAEEREMLLQSERAARTEAERMSEVKDAFLATLSHELRTPLNAIVGWSMILRTGARDGPAFEKALDTIERNARVQAQLIEDLLDMSRITSGKLRLDVERIQPITVVEAAVETVRPAADAKGITLETLLDPGAGPVSGDPSRLQQVVWNLLSNAIKFTPKDGKVQVVLERVNSHIELCVADTGAGIRGEFLPHLFERFRQADASTTRKHGGLGLGLSIVKNLVELHGGTIEIKSPGEGLGTTAIVQLPLMVAQHRGRDDGRRHPSAPAATFAGFETAELRGLKVLIVDDQEDARDLLKRVLEECAAEVMVATSVDEAMRLLIARKPDVLISDIGMPDADGFELIRRVRALGPEGGGKIPAIALTAFARSEDRTRALRAGFLVHVSKPVDPSELVATVASVADRVREPSTLLSRPE